MSECTLYVAATGSPLRDVVSKEKLQEHMQQFGEVKEIWIPWKRGDKRPFGFLTFKGQEAGVQAVKSSPHTIGEAEVVCDFKRQRPTNVTEDTNSSAKVIEKKGEKMTKPAITWNADGDPPFTDFLVKVTDEDLLREDNKPYSWKDYLAPSQLIQELQCIGEELDPKHLERKSRAREKLFGRPDRKIPGVPLVLFHGPPGTGKTMAMKVLAKESGLNAYILKSKTLQSRSRQPDALFERILKEIDALKNAIIYIDECEILFPRRDVMAMYASVDVRGHQRIIGTFLDWSDGLMTQSTPDGSQFPLICLATNLKDQVDPAIMDRAKRTVYIGLPGPEQCSAWWSLHAQQLTPFEVKALGWLSWAARHSFRAMDGIAETMVSREAHQIQEPDVRPGKPAFREYVAEFFRTAGDTLPTFLEALKQMPRWIWSLYGYLWFLDLVRRRILPRARL